MAGFSILGLSGPAFLGVYAGVAALTLLMAHLFIRASDPTRDLSPPKVPSEPDAIMLAYLAGGVGNVIRTLLFDLRQRGYVGVGADKRLEPAAGPQSGRVLDARPARCSRRCGRGRRRPSSSPIGRWPPISSGSARPSGGG